MSGQKQPLRGTFVLSWAQTTADGEVPHSIEALRLHADWSWTGDAVCIDASAHGPREDEALRQRAAGTARRILGHALVAEAARDANADDLGEDRVFSVTDGIRTWVLTLIELPELPRPLVMFAGDGPPPDKRLVISKAVTAAPRLRIVSDSGRGMVCFTPGTRIETPRGLRAVEELLAGDKVATRDNGEAEILWVGQRQMSGARLHAMPDLRPVRIRAGAMGEDRPDADLVVSPDHRMLITGDHARAVWGEPEVLVAARDLIDDRRITRDFAARAVSYIHLLLPAHNILTANGMQTESFHPDDADLDMVLPDQRQRLFDVLPGIELDPASYGIRARRVLSGAEAAILRGVAQA